MLVELKKKANIFTKDRKQTIVVENAAYPSRPLPSPPSLDLVRSRSEYIRIDLQIVQQLCFTRSVILSFAMSRSSIGSFESIRVVMRSYGNSMLSSSVARGRDEGAERTIDGERREVDPSQTRNLSLKHRKRVSGNYLIRL